jgi:hypothetical protein
VCKWQSNMLAGGMDEEPEVGEGSRDIRVGSGGCQKEAYFVPRERNCARTWVAQQRTKICLSCGGGFLRSFREQMRGFHDSLKH